LESGRNEEYFAEKKKEEDKWNRQITMYIEKGDCNRVQSYNLIITGETPWYAEQKQLHGTDKHRKKRSDGTYKLLMLTFTFSDKEKRKKEKHDPLTVIQHTLSMSKKKASKAGKLKSSTSSKSKSIDQLRQERLQRELDERQRAKALQKGSL
jgi:hypothetical protein